MSGQPEAHRANPSPCPTLLLGGSTNSSLASGSCALGIALLGESRTSLHALLEGHSIDLHDFDDPNILSELI